MAFPLLQHKGQTLYVDNSKLVANTVAETYLTTATTGGSSTTLSVKNIVGFAINQILFLGELGNENSEVVLTHASTTPTGTTITLTAALVKTHAVGTRVRVIPYNQIEFTNATTATGSKTALTVATTANFNPPSALGSGLVAVDATKIIQAHESSEHTSGFYFVRYKNSITADFSGYSDSVPYGGSATNTVAYMVDSATRDIGITLGDKIRLSDCFRWITKGMSNAQGKLYRWPEHISYNAIIGQAQRGTNVITMPTDAYDTETNKSIIGVRIGDNKNLEYLDPITFDNQMEGVRFTQVRTQAVATDTSLAVDNSYDFSDGSATSPARLTAYISGTKDTFTYTGVTRDDAGGATAAFTGIPASGDDSIENTLPVDTYIWQDEDEGIPRWYTVRNGALEFWPLVDASEDNANVYMDYAKVATTVNSAGDTIDFQRFDFLQDYLAWRMWCVARNDGVLDYNNGYFLQYKEGLNDAIRTLPPNNKFRMMPRVNRMLKRGRIRPDIQDIDISEQ